MSHITIERCPHDKENPYSMISNALIRDESISPNCRWLLIYLLSNKDGWRINFSQIRNHLKKFMGRDSARAILDEAIEAGYIKREDEIEKISHGGALRRCKYILSESPKFKECLPRTEFQEAGDQEAGNTDDKEATYPSSEGKKNYVKERSAVAVSLTEFFKNKLKERKPKAKIPTNLDKWEEEMEKMLTIDKRTPEEIKAVIEAIPILKNQWYCTSGVLSVQTLRKHYDAIEGEMDLGEQKALIAKNRNEALKNKDNYPEQLKDLIWDTKGITNKKTGKDVPFNLPHETFMDAFAALFGGSR